MKNRLLLILLPGLLVLLGLAACSPAAPSAATALPTTALPVVLAPSAAPVLAVTLVPAVAAPSARAPTTAPQLTVTQTAIPTLAGTPTPDTRPDPKYWSSWPVIPTLSAAAQQIYQRGITMGNDPHVFSTVGDCQSAPNVFLGIYESDRSPLGPAEGAASAEGPNLQQTVRYYAGSFSRQSLAVRDGLSAPSALSPLWSDQASCQPDENPVQCELRLRKPSVMFVNLGTNWKAGASADRYEAYLRQIVDLMIAHGTLPILSTKADNVEGDHSLNLATAKVAHDYDIPLWNFWLAADSLPNHGLDPARDNVYLTPQGWDRRSFTALQVLDVVWRALNPAEGAASSTTVTAEAEGAPASSTATP